MTLIQEIYQNTIYFLKLTLHGDVLWIVLPLLIATVAIIVYFERYKEERPGWNTYFSNSLILLFVSIILLRYIHSIDSLGITNFTTYFDKTIVSAIILLIGIVILLLNFEHYLPEKIAKQLTSPLTLNLVAYISILYVYSEDANLKIITFSLTNASRWSIFISLIGIYIILWVFLNLLRVSMKKFFTYLKRLKDKEKKESIIQDKKPIEKKKKQIQKEEEIIRKAKQEVKKEEKKVEKSNIKELDKQKREAVKLKKIVKKPLKEVKK